MKYTGNDAMITIPDSVTHIGKKAFARCCRLRAITVDNQNECFADINGVLFDKIQRL